MADETLLTAAGRIADGEIVDWGSITSVLNNDDDRAIAEGTGSERVKATIFPGDFKGKENKEASANKQP